MIFPFSSSPAASHQQQFQRGSYVSASPYFRPRPLQSPHNQLHLHHGLPRINMSKIVSPVAQYIQQTHAPKVMRNIRYALASLSKIFELKNNPNMLEKFHLHLVVCFKKCQSSQFQKIREDVRQIRFNTQNLCPPRPLNSELYLIKKMSEVGKFSNCQQVSRAIQPICCNNAL